MRALPTGIWVFAILALPGGLSAAGAQEDDQDEMVVTAEGMAALTRDMGAAEEEAIWEAKRNAVERAAGIFLRARAVGRDFELEEDRIEARTDGFVRRWEVEPGSRRVETLGNGKVLRLRVRAVVALVSLIRRLADMKDVYDDFERPRIRIQLAAGSGAWRARTCLTAGLTSRGFEVAGSGPAEIVLECRMDVIPTVHLGDRETPYGLGEVVAACRARLTARVVSSAADSVLFAMEAEGAGKSFQSDAEAAGEAGSNAAQRLLDGNRDLFTQQILVRWARERQEGHTVSIEATGLGPRDRDLLREEIRGERGFIRFVSESSDRRRYQARFVTRLETAGIRRRLSACRLPGTALILTNRRGPTILCSARPTRRDASARLAPAP